MWSHKKESVNIPKEHSETVHLNTIEWQKRGKGQHDKQWLTKQWEEKYTDWSTQTQLKSRFLTETPLKPNIQILHFR
jgi:hypothetical protein